MKEWLNEALLKYFSQDTKISIIPRSWEPTGESSFFSQIDIQNDLSIKQLLSKVVIEHSRGNYIHFYADDVISAAITAKELKGSCFYLHYRW